MYKTLQDSILRNVRLIIDEELRNRIKEDESQSIDIYSFRIYFAVAFLCIFMNKAELSAHTTNILTEHA